jgi:hypothetical protein
MPRRKQPDTIESAADKPLAQDPSPRSRPTKKSRPPTTRRAVARSATPNPAISEVEAGPTVPGILAASSEGVTAIASVVTLDPGLFAIDITVPPMRSHELGPISLPLIWLSQPASGETDRLKIMTSSGNDDLWLGADGDLIIVRSPARGGELTVTVFGPPGQKGQAPNITVRRLNRAQSPANRESSQPSRPLAPEGAAPPTNRADIPVEILLHVERLGDRLLPGSGWVGNRGGKLRIEGFSIRPLREVSPADLQYKALHPGGIESPWTQSPQYCGSRGRGQRLTGFAVRLAPQLEDRMAVEYYGAFFDSGISGPCRDGEPCRPRAAEDTLEAMNIRVIRRE